MRLLLDSQILLWWLGTPNRLSGKTIRLISDPFNVTFVSVVTVWELGIKAAKGKLNLPEDFVERLVDDGFATLDVTIKHAQTSTQLPMIHFDPFDRMIVAQARSEDLVLISSDSHIRRYNVQVLDP